jgi:hypothetical protein
MVIKFDRLKTTITENDMSKSDRRIYDMLLFIIKQGRPISAWEACKKLKRKMANYPTVHAVFRDLAKHQLIANFDELSRHKIEYGVTWQGLVEIFYANMKMSQEVTPEMTQEQEAADDEKIRDDLSTIIEVWLNVPKFIEILLKDFGKDFHELITNDPVYAKEILRNWILYHVTIFRTGDEIVNSPAWLYYRTMIGEAELHRQHPNEFLILTKTFFQHVKAYRDNVNKAKENAIENQKRFEEFEPKPSVIQK